jgi:hypothetical protein
MIVVRILRCAVALVFFILAKLFEGLEAACTAIVELLLGQ